jgi:hypothetical protein
MNVKTIIDGAAKKVSGPAAKVNFGPTYWIAGTDQSISYCAKCIDKAVDVVKQGAEDPTQVEREGGWGSSESESPVFCEDCEGRLDYTLNTSGVKEELDHFEKAGINLEDEGQNFELERVLAGYDNVNEHTQRRIIKLAQKIIGE